MGGASLISDTGNSAGSLQITNSFYLLLSPNYILAK